eukprot:3471710-Pleurochrysis_carterae.AAC.2
MLVAALKLKLNALLWRIWPTWSSWTHSFESANSLEMQTALKEKYGNHAQNVVDVLLLWEAFAEMFSAWRDEWTDTTPEYHAGRALRFLRAGVRLECISFAAGLNKASSYKHQSWYVNMTVFIVAQQLFDLGNTWRFSTCAIESRGARLKRVGRRVVYWRPLRALATLYNYVDRRTQKPVRRSQAYSSSPMEQMLMRICQSEASWHDAASPFARPEKLRLQHHLRSCKLKCELADEVPVSHAVSMLVALKQRFDHA